MEEEHEGEVGDSRAEEEGGRGMEGELSSRGGGRSRRARVDVGSREDKKDQKVAKVICFLPSQVSGHQLHH